MIDQATPSMEWIIEKISNIENKRDKALLSILYLTASRVSEIVRSFKVSDFSIKEVNGKKVCIFDLPIEKRRTSQRRRVLIRFDKEGELLNYVLDYINIVKSMDKEIVFPISRTHTWRLVNYYLGFRPHFLRHTRVSHLVSNYKLPDQAIVLFVGWANSNQVSRYTHLRAEDLLHYFD